MNDYVLDWVNLVDQIESNLDMFLEQIEYSNLFFNLQF